MLFSFTTCLVFLVISLTSCKPGLFYESNHKMEKKGKEWEDGINRESALIKLEESYVPSNEGMDTEEAAVDEENELFEGDLAISKDIINGFYGKDAGAQTLINLRKWPDNNFYYTFDQTIRPSTKKLIQLAIAEWEQHLDCVSFLEKKSDTGYVRFQSRKPFCFSTCVGYDGLKPQIVNLHYPTCNKLGTIMHEIGHTLGYWHEQSRPDRDKYITIIKENIKPKHLKQFKKHSIKSSSEGLRYDYDSIMHYSRLAFSKNGQDTILVADREEYKRQGSPVIGQREHLSKMDVLGMRMFYGCM